MGFENISSAMIGKTDFAEASFAFSVVDAIDNDGNDNEDEGSFSPLFFLRRRGAVLIAATNSLTRLASFFSSVVLLGLLLLVFLEGDLFFAGVHDDCSVSSGCVMLLMLPFALFLRVLQAGLLLIRGDLREGVGMGGMVVRFLRFWSICY